MNSTKLVVQKSNSELSTEKLRSYSGWENYSDEELQEHLENIKRIARILFFEFKENQGSRKPHK